MTPKEKAKELVSKYKPILPHYNSNDNLNKAKQCALIVVDEIIKQEPHQPNYYTDTLGYWQEVKEEIVTMEWEKYH